MARIYNRTRNEALADSAELADTFFSRARGLMFRRRIEKPLIFIFDEGQEKNMRACAIHSLFVFFSFSAIYLDAKKRVVDVRVCGPFFSFMMPRSECAYLIEGEPGLTGKVGVGDVLEF
ncbi:MAG: DUF192 domain-containing protein [Candidatus Burarchaeum sp.]|nr:DUF192 domain-containing protein [Candidatus Burarchaeum sp.]MDO8340102.1 DUF192 domain-containing protein [Candidatus Burarchaeum sp.]